ncbi:MAG: envelope stress response membrane protein PspC [Pseudomonadota bacterium]
MPEHHHHHHHHWDHRGRKSSGYAHQAGRPGPGPNPHRFYRSRDESMFAGVCGGIAEYFGWEVTWVRIAWAGSFFILGPLSIFAYIIAAIVTKKRPLGGVSRPMPEDERFWRTVSTRPRVGFAEIKHKFRALDKRIADMEHAVVSEEYGLRRAFRDLERGAH